MLKGIVKGVGGPEGERGGKLHAGCDRSALAVGARCCRVEWAGVAPEMHHACREGASASLLVVAVHRVER